MGRPARLKHEIEHVREDILHAAGRAFSKQGFDSVTIHDIAKEAGYTTPSLYAYFKGKQEIIDALMVALTDEFQAAFAAEIPRGLSFQRKLAFLFERLAEISDRWPEVPLLMLEVRRFGTARFKPRGGRNAKQAMDAKLVDWLERNMTGPDDLGGRRPTEIAYIIRSLIIGSFLPNGVEASPSSPRARFTLSARVCLYGLAGRGRARQPRSR